MQRAVRDVRSFERQQAVNVLENLESDQPATVQPVEKFVHDGQTIQPITCHTSNTHNIGSQ